MPANGLLDLEVKFEILGSFRILLFFAGFGNKVEEVVLLLVLFLFVQFIRDWLTVVKRIEYHS